MLRSAWILGVGSLLTLWYAVKILLLSFSRNPEALCRSCDSVARRWSRAVLKLAGVTVQVRGVENLALDGAFIVIANHESWFDVWALAGYLPIDARFAAKKELERIPVFGRAWRVCGNISIDRAGREPGHHAQGILPDPQGNHRSSCRGAHFSGGNGACRPRSPS